MDEVVLRRSISEAENKDMADAVFRRGFAIYLAMLAVGGAVVVIISTVTGGIIGALLDAASSSSSYGFLRGALFVGVISVFTWVFVCGLGCALGYPLGLMSLRSRYEERLGPNRELILTWYQTGFSVPESVGSLFIAFPRVLGARRAGKQQRFLVIRTPWSLSRRPNVHGLPVDLIPDSVRQMWNSEGKLR